MPRARLWSLLLLGASLALAACAAQPAVTSELNPTVDFAAYRTYDWAPKGTGPLANERAEVLEDWRVRNEVAAELAGRGLAQSRSPDLFVDYGVQVHTHHTESFQDYARYVQEGGRGSLADAFVGGYEEGMLSVHFYDARTRELVWRATASIMLGTSQPATKTRDAIRQMFAKLPPSATR